MALEPITRQEQIIAGKDLEPITRMEKFLKKYGGSGGGVSPEEVTTIVKEQFPGGVGYSEVQTVNEPLNITWNGNTDGLTSLGGMLYKVSDLVLTEDQIKLCTVHLSDGRKPISFSDNWDKNGFVMKTDGVMVVAQSVVFVSKAGTIPGMGEVEESGIYFLGQDVYVSALTTTDPVEHTRVVTKKLDKKYIDGLSYYVDPENFVWTEVYDAYTSGALLYSVDDENCIMYACEAVNEGGNNSYVDFTNCRPMRGEMRCLTIRKDGTFDRRIYIFESTLVE